MPQVGPEAIIPGLTDAKHLCYMLPSCLLRDLLHTIGEFVVTIIGSLSTDVREPRTTTGGRMCPFLAWFCVE